VLARIVQVDAHYAVQHQALVMQCLEHSDATIQAKVSLGVTELLLYCCLTHHLLVCWALKCVVYGGMVYGGIMVG